MKSKQKKNKQTKKKKLNQWIKEQLIRTEKSAVDNISNDISRLQFHGGTVVDFRESGNT